MLKKQFNLTMLAVVLIVLLCFFLPDENPELLNEN